MTGGSGTKQTFEQVQQTLLNRLYANAKTLLNSGTAPPDPSKVTYDDINNIVNLVARQKFKSKYGYDYNGQNSQPSPPPADGKPPLASDGTASYDRIDDTIIASYVNDRILSGLALGWPRKSAEADLQGLGKRLFKDSTNNSWVVQDFQTDYQNQDSLDDEWEARTDSTFVFTNSELNVDGNDVKIVVLQYVGTWYNVRSRLKAARDYLLQQLLANARSLTPVGTATSGTETQQLERILDPYVRSKYLAQYGYRFDTNNTKPPDLIPGTTPYLRGSIVFALPSSNSLQAVTDYVKSHILIGLDIPEFLRDRDGKNGLALTDLATTLTGVLATGTDNSWFTNTFDKTYENPDDGQHSIRTSSVLIFTNGKATINGIECQQFYLYYAGIYYQINSPFLLAREKLLKELVDSARQLAPGVNPSTSDSPQLQLRAILDEYAKREFLARFGFAYTANPPDVATGRSAQRTSTLLYFEYGNGPVTKDTIRSRVDDSIIQSLFLSGWVQTASLNQLTDFVYNRTQEAVLNSWNSNQLQRQFTNATDPTLLDWRSRAIVTYANGQDFEAGRRFRGHVIHFLGNFYATNEKLDGRAAVAHVPYVKHATAAVAQLKIYAL
ncbi:hypothetical protein F5148DRAFT_1222819 [Russula earlei]|uniref:Uncharacterized protein n=1 Tax=Russula earlei TaxID=71964 RepID=A0ACC0U1W8_9AGAM|nr:hypothetical protein F5148DRAFT_1222819 [Russula earlei]